MTELDIVVDIGAEIPVRAHKTDAGLDLFAMKGGLIFPKKRGTNGFGSTGE